MNNRLEDLIKEFFGEHPYEQLIQFVIKEYAQNIIAQINYLEMYKNTNNSNCLINLKDAIRCINLCKDDFMDTDEIESILEAYKDLKKLIKE